MKLSYLTNAIGAYIIAYCDGKHPYPEVKVEGKNCSIRYKKWIESTKGSPELVVSGMDIIIPSGKVKETKFDKNNKYYYKINLDKTALNFIKNQVVNYLVDMGEHKLPHNANIVFALPNEKETDISFYALSIDDKNFTKIIGGNKDFQSIFIVKHNSKITLYTNSLDDEDVIKLEIYKEKGGE